jgi:hypothetical protein
LQKRHFFDSRPVINSKISAKYQRDISGQNSEITVVQQRDQRRHASFLMGMVPRCHRAVHIAQFVILSRTK